MSSLATLKQRLGELRRKRQAVRWGTAFSAAATAVGWTLAVMFLSDWLFEMNRLQRLILWGVGIAVLVWAYRKYAKPFLGIVETDLDMALWVERQQGIDSDLVGALQFETPAAQQWGSRELRTAVIDVVAEVSDSLDVFEGFNKEQMVRRSTTLAITVVVWGLLVALFPAHAMAFAQRIFLFSSVHYPSDTNIREVKINGQSLGESPAKKEPLLRPYGQPLQFEVNVQGVLPEQGTVQLRGRKSGLQTDVSLTKLAEDKQQKIAIYSGQLPRLVEEVDYQLYIGDDWTDAARLRVIALPVVDLRTEVMPPGYASAQHNSAEFDPRARQQAVIEGSRVVMHLESDKPLTEAVFKVGESTYAFQHDQLASTQATQTGQPGGARFREVWTLPTPGTPLHQVTEAVQYSIEVKDRDGLGLEVPIQGYIRLKADRPPRIMADMITRFVMPEAVPKIYYGAVDDYGVARVRIHQELIQQEGTQRRELATIEIPLAQPKPSLQDVYTVQLAPLKLAKGDQLKLTPEAIDYRGNAEGKSTLGEPIVIQVTDKQGVYEAMLESDRRSDRQLDAIIRRQLGIGGSQ